jgi:hypothetical protein
VPGLPAQGGCGDARYHFIVLIPVYAPLSLDLEQNAAVEFGV